MCTALVAHLVSMFAHVCLFICLHHTAGAGETAAAAAAAVTDAVRGASGTGAVSFVCPPVAKMSDVPEELIARYVYACSFRVVWCVCFAMVMCRQFFCF